MKKLFILILLSSVFLTNCNNQSKSTGNKVKEDSKLLKLQLQEIGKWPDDIEGCSCYSSKNKIEFDKEKYLYIANYNDLAYLNINGEIEKFKLIKTDINTEKKRF